VLPNLTGIRGLAAIWVLIYHFQSYLNDVFGELKWLAPVIDRGPYGVDLFFCLSGFIIAHVYLERFLGNQNDKKKELRQFFFKRFARLYPVYLITTLIALFMFVVAQAIGHQFGNISGDNLTFPTLIKNVFAIQILDQSPSLNYPSWSVSAEFLAYLSFPILVYCVFGKIKRRRLASGILLFLSISLYELQIFFEVFKNDAIIRVLTEFVMGLSCYLLIKDLNFSQKRSNILRLLMTTLFIASLYAIPTEMILDAFIPLSLLGIIAANFFHNSPNRGLGRKVFVKLGLWSYSLYLTHGLIHYILGGIGLPIGTDNFFIDFFQLVLIFLVTFLVAQITTVVIENPCRRFLLKKSN
jgi:peptidoglycan/LPS O-acetylase OafA/YrhL